MRGEYSTRQKRELMSFLKEHELENFSVDDVVFHMQGRGSKVGRSTVYRYLESLAEQGNVRKYQNVQGVTQYQHIDDDEDCTKHFHMMCKQCGTLYHVDCALTETFARHIAEEHGFLLDSRETVMIGICRKCSGAEREGNCDGAHHSEGCHDCI